MSGMDVVTIQLNFIPTRRVKSKSKLFRLDDVARGGLNYTDYLYSMVCPRFCYQKSITTRLSAVTLDGMVWMACMYYSIEYVNNPEGIGIAKNNFFDHRAIQIPSSLISALGRLR